jgi:hypothetical protein
MAFTWTTVTAGTTNITATVMNEVKTNVDHLTTQLGVSAYSWSTLPVTQYNKANAANLTELQNAISYVDGLNTCATHNATANSSENAGQDVAIHTGKDSSVLTGQDVSIHTGKDASVLTGQDVSIHTGKDSSVLSGQDASIHSGKDATIHSSKDVTVHTSVQTTHYNDHNTINNNPYYSGVYGTQYVSNCSTNWSTAQNSANGTAYLGN